jgi:hypothetical protein
MVFTKKNPLDICFKGKFINASLESLVSAELKEFSCNVSGKTTTDRVEKLVEKGGWFNLLPLESALWKLQTKLSICF